MTFEFMRVSCVDIQGLCVMSPLWMSFVWVSEGYLFGGGGA